MNRFSLMFHELKGRLLVQLLDGRIPSLGYFGDIQIINRQNNSNISFEYWIYDI